MSLTQLHWLIIAALIATSVKDQTSEWKTYKYHQAQVMTLIFFQAFIKLTSFRMTFSHIGHSIIRSSSFTGCVKQHGSRSWTDRPWVGHMFFCGTQPNLLCWCRRLQYCRHFFILHTFTKVTALHFTARLLDKHFPLHSFPTRIFIPPKTAFVPTLHFLFCFANLRSKSVFPTVFYHTDGFAFQKPISQFSNCAGSV